MKKLICSTFREGYGIDQIRRTMTAGELINFLAQYDEDTPVYLSFAYRRQRQMCIRDRRICRRANAMKRQTRPAPTSPKP